MSSNAPNYPEVEMQFLHLLKELIPILSKALNSLGVKKPANAGANYLGRIAIIVSRAADGYLLLRESGRMDASKLLIRPALEAVFCGTAAVKNKEFLFRKAYSEWEEDNKLFAKNAEGKKQAKFLIERLKVAFKENCPEYPIQNKSITVWETANIAGLLILYEQAYRIYCKFTHGAMRAVEGHLDQITDLKDTHTIVWCVLITLNNLKEFTPANIPDLRPYGERLAALKKAVPDNLTTTRIPIS
jgi:hypothetical protein